MFYLRLNKIKIFKKREFIGKAEVQIVSFISKGEDDFPSLKKFFDSVDEEEKEKLLEEAIKEVVATRELTPVYKVKNRHELYFGDTGYIVYKSKEIPDDFSWLLLAIELDGRTRSTGAVIKSALKKSKESDLVKTISNLANTSSPTTNAVIEIVNIISSAMTKDKDDQIGMFVSSFIRVLDYPHGIRDRKGVSDLSGNMLVDYTIFGNEKP